MARHNNLKTIHHWSAGYELLRMVVEIFFRAYYRRFAVRNKTNVPDNVPVILAPNHQNALMDALAILMALHGQPVFLARADIFRKKLLAKILHFLNIMPVYRMRDGAENLSQNDEIFDASLTILKDRERLCLMPEGNHGDKRKLRPLVKGIFRIAFMAQKENGTDPFVKIVPVGIDYSDYSKFRQKLFVNFGEPIDVSEYYAQWEANPALGMNALRDRLSEEMSRLMIDIRSEEHYEAVLFMREIYNDQMLKRLHLKHRKLGNEHDADREMIRRLQRFEEDKPIEMRELAHAVNEYKLLLEKNNLRDWIIRRGRFPMAGIILNWLLQILILPVYLFGLIHNALPYFIPVNVASKIKDLQFRSSVKMALGMIIFILQFAILASLAFIFLPYSYSILYLMSIPLSGWLAFNIYIWWRKTMAKFRFHNLTGIAGSDISKMIELREQIVTALDEIITRYGTSYQ